MLYYLYEHFGINIFHYISVRAIIAFFIAFALTMLLMPKYIKWAKSKNAIQPINEYAPENHQEKKNTPTMGGIVFIFSALVAVILCAKFNFYVLLSLVTAILFMLIGIYDDYKKITHKNNLEGLSTKEKFIVQSIAALIISFALYFYGFDTHFYVPFYKQPLFDMGIFAPFFWAFVIVGMSNAVNLTDGLDGLATVPSIFSFLTLSILLYLMGNAVFSSYLYLPFELGVGEVVIISTAFMGALLGFLWYNANPAHVYMGDSGSLTLGALIGLFGIITKSEILLGLIGFIFVIETLSVIIQVTSVRYRNKKVFKMAPIHHHFEKKEEDEKWSETQISVRFWIIALIANIIAILSIKIR